MGLLVSNKMSNTKKYLLSLIVIVLLAGLYIFSVVFMAPHSQANTVAITIEPGESFNAVVNDLYQNGVITNSLWIRILAKAGGWDKRILAGTHILPTNLSTHALLQALVDGRYLKPITLTVSEGMTLRQIDSNLENLGFEYNLQKIKLSDLTAKFPFLKDFPAAATLEGFLTPNTYYLQKNTSATAFLEKILGQFEDQIYPLLKTSQFTKYQELTIASLLEGEVKTLEDKALVAGIIEKRLKNDMPLQVDATLVYYKCNIQVVANCRQLIAADFALKTPFNSYQFKGLPPEPIGNPGKDSIMAAVAPQASDYLFYLTTPDGNTIFSKTFEEHKKAQEKYL